MKNIRIFFSANFHFLVVKFSVYLNRRVFVMDVLSSEDMLTVTSLIFYNDRPSPF